MTLCSLQLALRRWETSRGCKKSTAIDFQTHVQ